MNRLLEILLYIYAFVLVFQTRYIIVPGVINGGFSEYLTISVYFSDLILFLILAIFIYKKIRDRKVFKRIDITIIFLAGFEFFVFLSIFFSDEPLLSSFAYFRLLLCVGLFFVISDDLMSARKFKYAFFSGVLIHSFIGIYQFLSQTSFSNKYLGIASHSSSNLGDSVIQTIFGERWLRAYGGFDHPNMFGGILVICILLAVGNIMQKKYSLFDYIVIPFFSFALLFTFSRSAWLSLIVSILFLLLYYLFIDGVEKFLKLVKLSIVILFIFTIAMVNYSTLFVSRFSTDVYTEIKSIDERSVYLSEAGELLGDNALFGVGVSNYTKSVSREVTTDQPSWYYQPVHNFFILLAVEIGVIGLIFILLFILRLGERLFTSGNPEGLVLIISLLTISFFDHYLWSLHAGIFILFLVFGTVYKSVNFAKK